MRQEVKEFESAVKPANSRDRRAAVRFSQSDSVSFEQTPTSAWTCTTKRDLFRRCVLETS